MRLAAWLVYLAWLAAAVCAQQCVRVRVQHPWYNSSAARSAPMLEMLESARAVWTDDYFSLLSMLWSENGIHTQLHVAYDDAPPAALYTAIEALLVYHTRSTDVFAEAHLDEWRANIALHSQAAMVAAQYQLYESMRLAAHAPGCRSWVHWQKKAYCSAAQLRAAVLHDLAHGAWAASNVYPDDAVYAPRIFSEHAPVVVLYADPYAPENGAMHAALMQLAKDAPLRYVLRWKPSYGRTGELAHAYIGGYGIALHLKKVDYLVIDDRAVGAAAEPMFDAASEASVRNAQRTFTSVQDELYAGSAQRASVAEAVAAQADIPQEYVAILGFAVSHLVLTSTDPLETLEELTRNFPAHAAGLVHYVDRMPVPNPILDTLAGEQAQAGMCAVWINGKEVDTHAFTPLGILPQLHAERSLLRMFAGPELGISPSDASALLTDKHLTRAFLGHEAALFDASDRVESRDAPLVAWINDLEAYADVWYTNLNVLLQPRFPGQPLMLASNFFNLLVLPDLGLPTAFRVLAGLVHAQADPLGLHIGVMPLVQTQRDETLAAVLWAAIERLPAPALGTLLDEYAERTAPLDPSEARAALREMLEVYSVALDEEDHAFFRHGTLPAATAHRIAMARAYMARLHIIPQGLGAAFMNGQAIPLDRRVLQTALGLQVEQTRLAAEAIMRGEISKEQAPTYFYDLPTTRKSRSKLVSAMEEDAHTYINLPHVFSALRNQDAADTSSQDTELNALRDFVYSGAAAPNVTVRVVADFDAPQGTALLQRVLAAAVHASVPFRVGTVHIPTKPVHSASLSHFLYCAQSQRALQKMPAHELLHALERAGGLDALIESYGIAKTPAAHADVFWQRAAKQFVQNGVDVRQGPSLVINGLALNNLDPASLDAAALNAGIAWEATQHAAPVVQAAPIECDAHSQNVELLASLLGTAFATPEAAHGNFAQAPPARINLTGIQSQNPAAFSIGDAGATVHVTLLLDPLADDAPGLVSTAQMLASLHDTLVTIVLNPAHTASLPLQKFSQFTAQPRPAFDSHGALVPTGIDMHNLPPSAVLTMELLAPRSLVAMPDAAVYDLDNLRLADLSTDRVEVVYGVKSILVEGYTSSGIARVPRGLALVLHAEDGQALDTIVMENLGYFQFRAQPGVWRMDIHAGRSKDVYTMTSTGTHSSEQGLSVAHLLGKTLYPTFAKRAGMENADLVTSLDVENSGAWTAFLQRIKHAATSAWQRTLPATTPHASINIFTLASGHLYERMTYIMILSVLRHTKSTVKFWFVENFLSPSFKRFIPHLAAAYHFEYQLITYAWPEWLNKQTEKQRIIWAYKILFLDVLFPLDLDRVIFVDADQIVRTDLQALVDMDLQGAPYAYPPMGEDSEDMDGFRFWRQGYWKNFLRGRPYHISALYVVDLKRFRAVAAGDILRKKYQMLSMDKNNLANLDQDLPNNLQTVLPIHTLDKTWLWCETWCSNDWLPLAKTIDLCSNPKTKEPKLDRARRQIPEWNALDEEVAALAKSVAEGGQALVHDEL
ncbi:killer toxin resistant protein [Malassezia vespertilionis]|uniref:UDP-glucose:glycoprotein glucosyltransferase n=1 Tax=Malassezia vespertilionis TaxID=2020962 RepID=A0A2N1J898_9BASI|nr:killer toxin resistant protein [Malassezia vespertilionis]PKI82787.1 hypothetical protein MVES_003298 [Malassezia vespertilionis]WFD08368.1 killer toxin resistant protein [Malassezia vespertilionis]